MELQARIDEATEPADEEADESDGDSDQPTLSAAELRALRKDLAEAKRVVRQLKAELLTRLDAARAAMSPDDCAALALELLHDDLIRELSRYVEAHRQLVIAAYEEWWDKYRRSLREIEEERASWAGRFTAFTRRLAYVQ